MIPNHCVRCRSAIARHDGVCPVFGSPPCLAPDGSTMIGRVLDGRYELLHVLAAGAMGTVFRAWQGSTNRDVAVKVLAADRASRDAEMRCFVDEAKALGRLSHPHAVSMIDFGCTEEGQSYLVMELLHGVTLRELVTAQGPLPVERALQLCSQVLEVLHSAHAVGIVHRDIKPENLMLLRGHRHRDFVKVLDFGVARLREAAAPRGEQPMIGTLSCMAPEQATGEPIDGRADLYAVGCVLYYLLGARFPFADRTPGAMLRGKLESPTHDLAPALPEHEQTPELRALLRALLARHPADRPASASAASRLVQAALQASGSDPRPAAAATEPYRVVRVTSTNRERFAWLLDRTEELFSLAQAAAEETLGAEAPPGLHAIQAALVQDGALFTRWLLDLRTRLREPGFEWGADDLLDAERIALRLTVFGLSHREREAVARDGEVRELLERVIAAHRSLSRFLEQGSHAPVVGGRCPFCVLLSLDERGYLDDLEAAATFFAHAPPLQSGRCPAPGTETSPEGAATPPLAVLGLLPGARRG